MLCEITNAADEIPARFINFRLSIFNKIYIGNLRMHILMNFIESRNKNGMVQGAGYLVLGTR